MLCSTNKGKGRAQDLDSYPGQELDTVSSISAVLVDESSELDVPASRQRSDTVSSFDFATTFSSSSSPRQDSVASFAPEHGRRNSAASSMLLTPSLHRAGLQTTTPFSPDPNAPYSPSGFEHRRYGHTRTRSSLSSGMTDFFGPGSLASNSTAASSFASPRLGSHTGVFWDKECAQPLADGLDAIVDADRPQEQSSDRASSIHPPIESEQHAADDNDTAAEPQQTLESEQNSNIVISDPPVYARDVLPAYEEAPAYSPSSQMQVSDGLSSRPRTFRAEAAHRFLSSRLGKKLTLPPTLRTRLENLQEPTGSTSTHIASHGRTHHLTRSGSLPDLHTPRNMPRHLELQTTRMAAQNTYRYSARPRDPAWGRRQPASHVILAPRSQFLGPAGRTTYSQPPTVTSRRNSRESRRSNATGSSNGGASSKSNRSDALLSNHFKRHKQNFLRHLGVKSVGDAASLRASQDRELNASASTCRPDPISSDASPIAVPRIAVSPTHAASCAETRRETVASVTEETLISARVPVSCDPRPSLLHPAYSSPQAEISATSTSPSLLVTASLSRFDQLPREIILACFRDLVDLHVREHHRAVDQGSWRGKITTETRWVAIEAAVRELIRLSVVSRSWQSYTLDGQLWQSIDFSAFPQMTDETMLRIARSAGPFVRKLHLRGMANLRPELLTTLFGIQQSRQLLQPIVQTSSFDGSFSQLQDLDLEGCHQLSPRALYQILSRSIHLTKCNVSNLASVGNSTLCALAQNAQSLEILNISRCRNVNGDGFRRFLTLQDSHCKTSVNTNARTRSSRFRELHAAGVSAFDNTTMELLGRVWPNLEVLDLSYCAGVRDADIAALVSSDGDDLIDEGYYVPLSPRQAGSQNDDEVIRRTFPSLKKLKLSFCRLLTDKACTELAHAAPSLEVLELANIGAGLKDRGLVKLLATVPHLQRLDLERATHITDAVISALTPPASHVEAYGRTVPEEAVLTSGERSRGSILGRPHRSISRRRHGIRSSTQEESVPAYDHDAVAALIPATGTELTHLVLSSANKLSPDAMLLLINRCPFLYHMELDDTHANNAVATHFVRLARYRKVQNAYISMVDCRTFSRDTHSQLTNVDSVDGGVRPRYGERGYAYRHFHYDDAEPVSVTIATLPDTEVVGTGSSAEAFSTRALRLAGADKGNDECNPVKPVLKSFWGWQTVDARLKQKRKMEQRATRRHNKGKVGNVVAMAFGLPVAEDSLDLARSGDYATGAAPRPNPRWSRLLPAIGAGQLDDDEDGTTACAIM